MTPRFESRRGGGAPGAFAWAVLALGLATSLFLYRESRVPLGLLVAGLLVSAVLFGIIWSLSATNARAEALAETMTASLRFSEQRYARLFEQSPAGIFRTTPDGRILECNEAFARLFGYESRQDLLVQSAFSFYESAEARERFIEALRVDGTLIAYESRSRRKDGTLFWSLEHASLLPGPPEVIEGTIVDITARKEAEESLRQSRERYRSVIETSRDGLMVFDLATRRILETNPALQRMLGYTAEELSIRTLYDIGPADRASVDENIHRLVEEGTLTLAERNFCGKSGREIAAGVDVVLIEENRRQIVFAIVHNLSETRHLEEQLRQAQKMEAIGRLAGGVAHDFNNLLTAILGYADLLLESDPPDDVRKSADEIRKAGERAAALTRQLLAFSRKQVLQPRVLELNDVVKNLDAMLHRILRENVKIVFEPGSHLWRVKADPGQIEQILVNLAVNASDAMPEGGRLTIRTTNVTLGSGEVRGIPMPPGSYVLLEVVDTGLGMDAETLAHAFEPFFTTKERGKGTGLGLAMVYGVVKQSGAYVQALSEPGVGATFRIYLPRVHDPADSPSNVSLRPAAVGGSETILLVEDEESVRRLAQTVLQARGYRVLVGETAEAALELARAREERIHLLLTDVVLPGMDGRQLAEILVAERPGLAVLFSSGYFETRDGLATLENFLPKPFTPDGLIEKVSATLKKARPRPDRDAPP